MSIVKKVDRNVFQEENERNHRGDSTTKAVDLAFPTLQSFEKEMSIRELALTKTRFSIQDKSYPIDRDIENLIAKLGVKLKEMKEGEGFGEKALVEKANRSTSVVTNSNCEFIVIMKHDYMNIIKRFDKRHQIKSAFMSTKIPFLNTINSPVIWEDIYYLIKDIDRPKGSILANENETGDKIFFIETGSCELEKTIIVERNSAHYQYDSLKFKRTIARLDAGNCLGEEILVNRDQTYNYTIRVRRIRYFL